MNISKKQIESNLIAIAHGFLSDLKAERAKRAITLDATLDHDLGIDSLGKVEFLHRIEDSFSIRLPEKAMVEADTLRDLSKIIYQSVTESTKIIQVSSFTPIIQTTSLDVSIKKNLIEVLTEYALTEPNRPHLYLQNEFGETKTISYGKLHEQAVMIAGILHQKGVQFGETVAIMLPTSEEFFYAFFGVLFSGAIPVPIYPPFRPDKIEEYAKREANILNNAQVKILITFSEAKMLSHVLQSFIPCLKEVVTLKNLQIKNTIVQDLSIPSNAIALIQYTSGSTGDPKGVTITHGNILANIRAIGKAIPIQPTDIAVSWLPLYHDMGLMTWLGGLYFGIPVTILSPITFLTRPERWLWAIHYHRATISGGPNFAYELCIKKIDPKDIEGLDLSSWKFAFNGAEAVNPKTLYHFAKKFSPYGFALESFAPVYGLAESTVGLTFPVTRRPPHIDIIQRIPFEKENKAIPCKLAEKKSLEFVSSGSPLSDHFIRIVDDKGIIQSERTVGNLQFKGPSSTKGYFNNSFATQKAFHNGWWDTGDLAYCADNEIFIVGRKKDLIIKAGRNIYPEEIEEVVNQIKNIRKGCVIAFGINDPNAGTEKLVIVAETYLINQETRQDIHSEIIDKMAASLDITPDEIILVPPKTIPKTSSGKLQRSACKQAYIDGKLIKPRSSSKFQLIKLTIVAFYKKVCSLTQLVFKSFYAIYIALLLLITFPIWLNIFLLPRSSALTLLKYCSKCLFTLAFCPLKVTNENNLKSQNQVIFASNHSSYLDALVLLTILPLNTIFVAKKELLQTFILGRVIKKFKYLTVDRIDFTKSIEAKHHIEKIMQEGYSIAIFPEGTFTSALGLRPFKLGAFVVAAETNTPICPIAISGTRTILRGESFLPKPGTINVVIGEPVFPLSPKWDDVLQLQSNIREYIALNCHEPTIDIVVAGPEQNS